MAGDISMSKEDKQALEKEIVQTIEKNFHGHHSQDVFYDWCELSAIAINNQVLFNQDLENRYMNIINKYSSEQQMLFCEMLGKLTMLFDIDLDDYLGKLYMMLDGGGNRMGQFFTPYHLSYLTSKLNLTNYNGEDVFLNEPSCGACGLMIGALQSIKEKGFNYQDKVKIVANDLDFKCVYMTYVQLSLCGVSAKVTQGNTLLYEQNLVLYTPMYVMRGDSY